MRASTVVYSLLALAAGQAYASSISHGHAAAHKRMHELLDDSQYEQLDARDPSPKAVTAWGHRKVKNLGIVSCGKNSHSPSDIAWIGGGGKYTNRYINKSGKTVMVVIWGPEGSWINVHQPEVTIEVPSGQSRVVSFSPTASGAFAVIGEDTQMKNGQICDTWGEFTFGQYGTVDVSREVNMNGRSITIEGPKCTTSMDKCVFVCAEGNSCLTNYKLLNCEIGSQPGANYGTYGGAPSGGCSGMGESAHLKTYIH